MLYKPVLNQKHQVQQTHLIEGVFGDKGWGDLLLLGRNTRECWKDIQRISFIVFFYFHIQYVYR